MRSRRRHTRRLRRRKQRGGLDWNTVNMNRYANNAEYRLSINAQNNANYNAAIAEGKRALSPYKNYLSNSKISTNLNNVPNTGEVIMTQEEINRELDALIAAEEGAAAGAGGAAAPIRRKKFANYTQEELNALTSNELLKLIENVENV
jgi:hypothetical protein